MQFTGRGAEKTDAASLNKISAGYNVALPETEVQPWQTIRKRVVQK
jgi:hypothetical protein